MAHRRDYFDGILEQADLWKIVDLDQKFIAAEVKKRALIDLIAQIAKISAEIASNSNVAMLVNKIVTLDDVDDAFSYIHLNYCLIIEQLNLNSGRTRKLKLAPWKSLYLDCKKNEIEEMAKLFNINYNDFVLSVTGQQTLHFPEDHPVPPLVAADTFISNRFGKADAVLKAARHMIAHEISCNSTLRSFLRRIYFTDAVVSVVPTDKGSKEIESQHPYYVRFHNIYNSHSNFCPRSPCKSLWTGNFFKFSKLKLMD
jgi:transcription elongation factor SPT6